VLQASKALRIQISFKCAATGFSTAGIQAPSRFQSLNTLFLGFFWNKNESVYQPSIGSK